jgi:hypothetical protein
MKEKLKKYKWYYGITVTAAIMIVAVSFSPLVIPHHTFKPELAGLPYSLWMGILTTISLVFLTYISTRVHPGSKEEILRRKESRK